MKVFVSSTCYDLIDIRSEIRELLRDLGISALMSDEKLSDFEVFHSENSIQTCLVNVASADEVVVLLDRRYGPKLGKQGFEDVSATHLEYREAVRLAKPIHFFVRNRLEADYSFWKRNGKPIEGRFAWVQDPRDFGLFNLLDEHASLDGTTKRKNWFSSFTDSIDLKSVLRRYFRDRTLPDHLKDAINRNQFPLLQATLDTDMTRFSNSYSLTLKVTITNVTSAPAFNFRCQWDGAAPETVRSILAPGCSTHRVQLETKNLGQVIRELKMEYESALGVTVRDSVSVTARLIRGRPDSVVSGVTLAERKFIKGANIAIEIEDA